MSKKLKLLDIDDARHLNAAQGWLELGDFVSANEELDEITPEARAYPTVLNMRYQIYVKAKKWDMAAEIALGLTQMLADDPAGWIYLAYAVRRKTDTGIMQAKEILLEVEPKFPREYLIPYNLACYYSQLRQFEDAQMWFKKAMAINSDKVKNMALEDEDLKPFWDSMSGTMWKRE